jgi:hypothetical protein
VWWVMVPGIALTLALAVTLALPRFALANVALTQLSSDPFTSATCTANNTTNHHTEVEPDTFSSGSTIVATFQVGRIFDGGSCDIGFATSSNNGGTWTSGLLPGITKFQGGGPFDRVSDPSVAFDSKHNGPPNNNQGTWLISSLAITEQPGGGILGAAVIVSRSTDGGLTWSNPVTIKSASGTANLDKNWTVCDDTSTSPFWGNCYTEWDDNGAGNKVQMSTSTDGGQSWGAAKSTRPAAGVIGGQPLVQPNGTVIVPVDNAFETAIGAFQSTNGGSSWSKVTTISSISHHNTEGITGLREGPLPSAEIDGSGKVYVVWSDCRFRSGCSSNDLVLSTSTNGTSWTAVTRINIDPTSSTVDHFIPGLAVDKATSGSTAHLGLMYYYYPVASCTISTCQLDIGFVSSINGGSSWSAPTQITGPITLSWIANTSQGRMVGDYISTSIPADGLAHSAFDVASAPTTGSCPDATDDCNEPTDTTTSGLIITGGPNFSTGDAVVFGGANANNGNAWVLAAANGAAHSR